MKKRNKVRRKQKVQLDEMIQKFFPPTSRMGVGIATPWERHPTLQRRKSKTEEGIPRLRLPRVAFYTAM